MKSIGRLSNGNYIIEATPDEWREYQLSRNAAPLPEILKSYRARAGITQQRLAEMVGISRNYLSQIERGTADNISLDVYVRILEVTA